MPTSDHLKKPHFDQVFIKKAMLEERSNHSHLVASSREELPTIYVNGIESDREAIVQADKADIDGIQMELAQENIFRG